MDAVAAYTCASDADLQQRDGQWLRAKSFDSFCRLRARTLVPVAEFGDTADLRIVQHLNGELLLDSRMNGLIFGVRRLAAYVSTVFTLERGDLILTGTSAGVGVLRTPRVALQPGDEVEIEIKGIETLRNGGRGRVVLEERPPQRFGAAYASLH